MIYKKLFLLFLLICPSFLLEQDTEAENTTDRSSIMRKMNGGGLEWSDNRAENIKTNGSSSLNTVVQDIMKAAPDMEDNYNTMEAIQIPIKKCCGPTEVLDEWYQCSERGSYDGQEAIADLTNVQDLSEISFQYLSSFSCQKRKINEYFPLNIFKNGSIEIEIDTRNNTKIISDYFCLDRTEIQQYHTDGLHVIICDSSMAEGISSYILHIVYC